MIGGEGEEGAFSVSLPPLYNIFWFIRFMCTVELMSC